MTTENYQPREFPRINLQQNDLDKHFFIQIDDQDFVAPHSVHDLSKGGVRVQLATPPKPGSAVTINFHSDYWHVSLFGTVCWSKDAGQGDNFDTGITFHSHEHEDSTTFCNLIEEMIEQKH